MDDRLTSYLALVHTDAPDNYGVSFPDVPGCMTAGDTLDEAMENASEALVFHIEGMREDGDPLPRARDIHELRADAEIADDLSDAIVIAVRVREPLTA